MFKKVVLIFQKYFIVKKVFHTVKKNRVNILAVLKSSKINIDGVENFLEIKRGDFKRVKININGNNNILRIDEASHIRNLEIIIQGDNHKVSIGKRIEIGEASIVCCGHASTISLGDDCMLASNINIKSCDGHAIYKNNEIINNSREVKIGNNVWIAQDVNILKGVNIGDNSVVGINSLVTSNQFDSNVIIAGVPAEVINTDITWGREGTK